MSNIFDIVYSDYIYPGPMKTPRPHILPTEIKNTPSNIPSKSEEMDGLPIFSNFPHIPGMFSPGLQIVSRQFA